MDLLLSLGTLSLVLCQMQCFTLLTTWQKQRFWRCCFLLLPFTRRLRYFLKHIFSWLLEKMFLFLLPKTNCTLNSLYLCQLCCMGSMFPVCLWYTATGVFWVVLVKFLFGNCVLRNTLPSEKFVVFCLLYSNHLCLLNPRKLIRFSTLTRPSTNPPDGHPKWFDSVLNEQHIDALL